MNLGSLLVASLTAFQPAGDSRILLAHFEDDIPKAAGVASVDKNDIAPSKGVKYFGNGVIITVTPQGKETEETDDFCRCMVPTRVHVELEKAPPAGKAFSVSVKPGPITSGAECLVVEQFDTKGSTVSFTEPVEATENTSCYSFEPK